MFDSESTLLAHLPLVRFLAQRICSRLPRNIDLEDLCSAGMLGLIDACAKFDPTRNIKFASFATFRIRGAILDSLRNLDWAPRALRHKGKSIQKAIEVLTSRFGRAPSQDQVASELNTSLDDYQKVLSDLDVVQMRSLYRTSEDGTSEEVVSVPGRPEDDPLSCYMRSEAKERLTEAIGNLPEQQRLVVTLYFYEELNLREVGLVLGLDAIRAARIRDSALASLRAAISAPAPLATANRGPYIVRRREAISGYLEPKAAA
jgi:RNA polymerase sigma factor for flagellar operon FliA